MRTTLPSNQPSAFQRLESKYIFTRSPILKFSGIAHRFLSYQICKIFTLKTIIPIITMRKKFLGLAKLTVSQYIRAHA